MRRKMAFSRFPRKPREPRYWWRGSVASPGTQVNGVTVETEIFKPSDITAGTQDARVTVHRVLLNIGGVITIAAGGSGVAGDGWPVALGVYLGKAGGESRSPLFSATADRMVDWMWIHNDILHIGAALPAYFDLTQLMRNRESEEGLIDIRAKRKMNEDQSLILTVRSSSSDLMNGHTSGTQTFGVNLAVSVLWSRTLR